MLQYYSTVTNFEMEIHIGSNLYYYYFLFNTIKIKKKHWENTKTWMLIHAVGTFFFAGLTVYSTWPIKWKQKERQHKSKGQQYKDKTILSSFYFCAVCCRLLLLLRLCFVFHSHSIVCVCLFLSFSYCNLFSFFSIVFSLQHFRLRRKRV